MSSRRAVSAKAAGSGLRHKPSIVNTNIRPQVSKGKHDRNDDEESPITWWRETAGQMSPILSAISLLALYGTTFYLPFLTHQSVQFVVCCFLLAISVLNASHYITAREHKRVTNTSALQSMSSLPRNVKRNLDGTHTIIAWRPSAFTEAIFLTYNPLVPALAYIWVRSFEPFISWLCLGLMLISSALLHLMNFKLRNSVTTEHLLLSPGSDTRSTKLESETPLRLHEREADVPHGYEERGAGNIGRGANLEEEYEFNHPHAPTTFDGPASAIFQVPPSDIISGVDPIRSHPSPPTELGPRSFNHDRGYAGAETQIRSPYLHQQHQDHQQNQQYQHQLQQRPWEAQNDFRMDQDVSPYNAPIGSPMNVQLSPNHERAQQQPLSRGLGLNKAPATPQSRSFGLRFGAVATPQAAPPVERHAPPPFYSIADEITPGPSKHKVLVTEDDFGGAPTHYPEIPDQSPPKILSPGRHNPSFVAAPSHTPLRFGVGATPSKMTFAAPPRFSMHDD